MNSQEYLAYLITTQQQHEAGTMEYGVKAAELKLLQALIESEK